MASTNIDVTLAQIEQLDMKELTTKDLEGTGVFDVLMGTTALHIQKEYAAGRIRGPEYSQVYLGGLQATLATAVQYLTESKTLGISIANQEKQGLLTEAQTGLVVAQTDQVTKEVTLKLPAEVDNIRASTEISAANKLQITQQTANLKTDDNLTLARTEQVGAEITNLGKQGQVMDQQILESTFRVTSMLPKELEQITAQIVQMENQGNLVEAQTIQVTAETATKLPAEIENIKASTALSDVNKDRVREELTLIPLQGTMLTAQTGQVGAQTILTNKQTDQLTAELAKIPVEVELLQKQVINSVTQNELLQSQVEGSDLQNSKVPKEIAILEKQVLQTDAQIAMSAAQTNQVVAETTTRLPVEVLNLTKQGENLTVQKELSTAQKDQTIEQTKRIPYDIEEVQARITNMTKQNLLAEKDIELKQGQLELQVKQLLLSEAELEVKRQEIQVQLAAIESQRAQADLYAQKVKTEKAQTEGDVAKPGSVLGANVAVLMAQAEGYKSDRLQKATQILVSTWNVRRNSDDATEANVQNQLHDANIGVAVTGLLVDSGLTPNTTGI